MGKRSHSDISGSEGSGSEVSVSEGSLKRSLSVFLVSILDNHDHDPDDPQSLDFYSINFDSLPDDIPKKYRGTVRKKVEEMVDHANALIFGEESFISQLDEIIREVDHPRGSPWPDFDFDEEATKQTNLLVAEYVDKIVNEIDSDVSDSDVSDSDVSDSDVSD